MWNFFLQNNRFTYLLIIALIGFGIYAINDIPKESAPDISIPIGIVTTVLPGANSEDVESLVTNEIERRLSGRLNDVKQITSTSQTSVSSVVVEFTSGTNLDQAIQNLTREVDRLKPNLPSDATDPIVTEVNFSDQPIVTLAIASDLTPREQNDLAEQVKRDLEQVAGVARVEVSGIRTREISVVVRETDLIRYNITIDDVVRGIQAMNTSLPIGAITTENTTYSISFSDTITDPSDLFTLALPIPGPSPILLSDIATIIDGVSETTSISRISTEGNPSESAFTLNVFKRPGGDVGRISGSVIQTLESLQETGNYLEPFTVYIVLDVGTQNAEDLLGLVKTGLQTVLFVILVLFITIGWREGLVAGLAIPLSFVIGFIGLYLSGNTINFISLFALILGVGILVDSGIVMVEGINKRLKADPDADKVKAAYDTVKSFTSPLTAGTLTTVAMFSGLFIVSGVTGEFIASIPVTLIFILFASLLVALGFLPLIATTLLKRRSATIIEQKQTQYAQNIEDWYKSWLTTFLKNKRKKVLFVILLGVGFISALSLPAIGAVKVVFFEQTDIDFVFVDIELPEGSTVSETDKIVRQVEETLYTFPEYVEGFSVNVGAGNAFSGDIGGASNGKLASFFINLEPTRPGSSTNFITILRDNLPIVEGVTITASEPNNGPPVGSPIQVKVTGDNLTEMSLVIDELEQRIASLSETINVSSSNSSNTTELVYQYDALIAARYGLTPLSVSQLLRTAVNGTEATTINTLISDIPVVVRFALNEEEITDIDQAREVDLDSLLTLSIRTPRGDSVPVSAVGTLNAREARTSIQHENQRRIMTVNADIAPGQNVIEVNRVIRSIINDSEYPDGITVTIGGENEESDQAFIELFLALIVGIVLMIAVLVLQFNSFRYTFYVLSIIPFSLIGIMYGLAITQNALSFPSIMGFIALTGIVVNNSILLIDKMNRLRVEDSSKSITTVVIEASTNRLRPIILTTITTVIGMIPLLTSDPIWVPLAFAVIFGLLFSVVITLLLVPIIYNKWPGKVSASLTT